MKRFSKVKQTVIRTTQQSVEWENIFTNFISNREVIGKTYKVLMELNIKKQKSNYKIGYRIKQIIHSREIQHV